MKRWTRIIVGMGVALLLQTAAQAYAQRVHTEINVGDPYRGTVYFRSAPDMRLIPDSDVYSIRGNTEYDLYRYNGWFYLVDDGAWYRARSWEGPFTYVRMNSVPRAVVTVPTTYRRTWTQTTYTPRTGRHEVTEVRSVRPGLRYRGDYLTFQVQPRMRVIPGTRVWYVRDDHDFDRDLYRFGNRWYYVENGVWYVASSWRGPFYTMRWRDVPASVRRVPAPYRRTWNWSRVDNGYSDTRTVVRVGERYRGSRFVLYDEPRMSIIPGTSVYYLREEADYDLYRYGNSWYMVDDGIWYRATSWRGPFARIAAGSVPRAVFEIPSGYRKTWVPTID